MDIFNVFAFYTEISPGVIVLNNSVAAFWVHFMFAVLGHMLSVQSPGVAVGYEVKCRTAFDCYIRPITSGNHISRIVWQLLFLV